MHRLRTMAVVAGQPEPVKVEGSAVAPGRVSVLVRPDWAELGGDLPGRVTHVWYRGPYRDYRLDRAAGLVEIRRAGAPFARPGERINWSRRRVWSVPDGAPGIAHV